MATTSRGRLGVPLSLQRRFVSTGTTLGRHRGARFVVVAAAVGLTATVMPAGIGSAAPSTHLTLSQVKAQVAALDAKAERITESYDGAHDRLGALQREARVTDHQLASDRSELDRIEWQVGRSASAAYRAGGLDVTLSLVSTGSAQTFIDQSASLNEVARYESEQVAAADAAQRKMSAVQAVHNAQVAQQRRTLSSIAAERHQIEGLLAQQKQVLNRMTAAAQHAYAVQQQAATARAVSERSSYSQHLYNGPATGQAATAVQFAYAQLGKPYVYGGAGPYSYDCSGLTMRAWGAAGVGLPHNAAAQQADIPAVSLSDLEPGDLVFFGSPAYHVAIYIGNGNIIQAPHTGASVEITPLSYMPPSGAGRP